MQNADAPRAPDDPLDRIGRLYARLNPLLTRLEAGDSRLMELEAMDLHEHLAERVTHELAATPAGAMLQLAVLASTASDLSDLTLSLDGDGEKEGQRLARACSRLAHSLVRWMEAAFVIDRASVGG